MGFGNPYGDYYSEALLLDWVDKIIQMEVEIISLADTVGLATPQQVSSAVGTLIPAYPAVKIGVHLHSNPVYWREKIDAALQAGCTRFDGALKGIGGCPMAGDELVGNMDTELMVHYMMERNLLGRMDMNALAIASQMAIKIFGVQ